MVQIRNIIEQAIVGPDAYIWALRSAYSSGHRLYDPSYALARDPAADEKIRRNPDILQAMNDRLSSVVGKEWSVEPASDDPKDVMLAHVVERMLRCLKDFEAGRRKLAEAIFDGRAYTTVIGHRRQLRTKAGVAPLWVPRKLKHVNQKRMRWGLVPQEGSQVGQARLECYSLRKGEWFPVPPNVPILSVTYDDVEGTLGYGRGLREAIFHYLWLESLATEELMQGIERWSQGMLIAKIDSLAAGRDDKTSEQIRDEYLDLFKKHRAKYGGIAVDARDEVTVQFPSGTGHQMAMDWIKLAKDSLRMLITGALLPSGGGGGTGSLARAEVEGSTIHRVTQMDRNVIDEAVSTDLIENVLLKVNRPQIVRMGLGEAEPPKYRTVASKTEDPEVNARVVQVLLASGVPLKRKEVYRKTAFTEPGPDDAVFEGAPPMMAGQEPKA